MIRILFPGLLALFTSGCLGLRSSPEAPTPAAELGAPTPEPTTVEPLWTPSASPPTPLVDDVTPERPALGEFGALPGNHASGLPAPDFSARLLGGGTFRLSSHRDSFVFLTPTAIGCSSCLVALQELALAYTEFRGRWLEVLIMNLYFEDVPESWAGYAGIVGEPEFLWGVVDSLQFFADYNLSSLGTQLLIDREGREVFRSENPLTSEAYRELFALATR